MTDKEIVEYFKSKLCKVCTNKVHTGLGIVPKDRKMFLREDLSNMAKEGREKGLTYIYVEPENPDYPLGPLKLSEPKYEYRIKDLRISEEEYKSMFENKGE